MNGSPPGAEIINACRLLFPTAVAVDPGFLNTIADAELKTAFRKKALKTHPDRSKALGLSQEELSRMFQEVSAAYKTLEAYFLQRTDNKSGAGVYEWAGRPASSVRSGRAAPADFFYKGGVPRRKLRLGEYMYYSRLISWRALIKAIVWQKRQRPLFGQIAREWKFLSDEEIRLILRKKARDEIFGEFALRHGFLSKFQQMAVTGKQRQLQPLFGMYFVENGILPADRIDLLVRRKEQHNWQMRFH